MTADPTRRFDRRRFLQTALAAGAVATAATVARASSHVGGTITVTSYGFKQTKGIYTQMTVVDTQKHIWYLV